MKSNRYKLGGLSRCWGLKRLIKVKELGQDILKGVKSENNFGLCVSVLG